LEDGKGIEWWTRERGSGRGRGISGEDVLGLAKISSHYHEDMRARACDPDSFATVKIM